MCTQIKYVSQENDKIIRVGGSYEKDGLLKLSYNWALDFEDLLEMIRRGEYFFVESPDGIKSKVIISYKNGKPFVKSTRDNTLLNNLDYLPEIPDWGDSIEPGNYFDNARMLILLQPSMWPGPIQPRLTSIEYNSNNEKIQLRIPSPATKHTVFVKNILDPIRSIWLKYLLPFPAEFEMYVGKTPEMEGYEESKHKLTLYDSQYGFYDEPRKAFRVNVFHSERISETSVQVSSPLLGEIKGRNFELVYYIRTISLNPNCLDLNKSEYCQLTFMETPKVKVPNIKGKMLDEAIQILEENQLKIEFAFGVDTTNPSITKVLQQSPSPNTKVEIGSSVRVDSIVKVIQYFIIHHAYRKNVPLDIWVLNNRNTWVALGTLQGWQDTLTFKLSKNEFYIYLRAVDRTLIGCNNGDPRNLQCEGYGTSFPYPFTGEDNGNNFTFNII